MFELSIVICYKGEFYVKVYESLNTDLAIRPQGIATFPLLAVPLLSWVTLSKAMRLPVVISALV